MNFGSDSSAGGQQVDPALQRFIAEETEKQKMQVMAEICFIFTSDKAA